MIKDTETNIKRRFQKRTDSYVKVFDKENKFTEEVLKDLAKFCRAHESTFHPDQRVHAQLEGRREVWLRIQESLKLSADEIFELHKIKEIR